MMTPSNSFGGSGGVSMGGDADLFQLDVGGIDFQMMGFQEPSFGLSDFHFDEFTSGLFPDGPLDSMTGTGG